MTRSEAVQRLVKSAVPNIKDAAARCVLEAAMREAMNITHECGAPENTDNAVLDTFWDAIRCAAIGEET
jgi:hypothetical protein